MSFENFPWRHELLGAAWVAGAFLLLFGSIEAWRRLGNPHSEWTRKAAHVGAGLVVCFFPWIFESPWSVAALCGGFFLLLLAARLGGFLKSVHGVDRQSLGELLFPAGVAGLAFLSWGRPDQYLPPMLCLVVSDAFAALVGKSFARLRYDVDEGESKSFEGSAVFFFLSFMAFLIPVTFFGDYDPRVVILVGLQWAFIVTCFEAISLSGVDNLVLPVGGWYLLSQMVEGDVHYTLIEMRAQGFCLALAAVAAWRFRFLSFSALLAAQLFLYGAFAYGSGAWLAAPLGVAALFLWAKRGATERHASSRVQVLAFYWAVLPAVLAYLCLNFFTVHGGPRLSALAWACRPLYEGLLLGLLGSSVLAMRLPFFKRGGRLKVLAQAVGAQLVLGIPLFWLASYEGRREDTLAQALAALLSLALFALIIGRWKNRAEPLGQARLMALCGAASLAILLALLSGGA